MDSFKITFMHLIFMFTAFSSSILKPHLSMKRKKIKIELESCIMKWLATILLRNTKNFKCKQIHFEKTFNLNKKNYPNSICFGGDEDKEKRSEREQKKSQGFSGKCTWQASTSNTLAFNFVASDRLHISTNIQLFLYINGQLHGDLCWHEQNCNVYTKWRFVNVLLIIVCCFVVRGERNHSLLFTCLEISIGFRCTKAKIPKIYIF